MTPFPVAPLVFHIFDNHFGRASLFGWGAVHFPPRYSTAAAVVDPAAIAKAAATALRLPSLLMLLLLTLLLLLPLLPLLPLLVLPLEWALLSRVPAPAPAAAVPAAADGHSWWCCRCGPVTAYVAA